MNLQYFMATLTVSLKYKDLHIIFLFLKHRAAVLRVIPRNL